MSEQVEASELREEVRAWLAANWRDGLEPIAWMELVFDAAWACPSWPRAWGGRELELEASRAVLDEFQRAGARGGGQDLSNIPANTLLMWGSEELKRSWLRPLVTGAVRTCLLYSEPGAGSDLAAVQTRAERDGDDWVVNGQKVWTTGGKEADFGLLIARTDWDVPKHQGITYFFCPMHQPGVEVRPIVQITGGSSFNEVFLTDARVPHTNLVGEEGNGWRVLATALSYERVQLGGLSPVVRPRTDPGALVPLAIERGRSTEVEVRQAIAELYCWQMVNRWNTLRSQGAGSPSVASINKIIQSRIAKTGADLELELLGMDALLDEEGQLSAESAYRYLGAFQTSLVGGTDEIQKNIIGERLLGLAREPELDRDVPFREVRKAAPTRRVD